MGGEFLNPPILRRNLVLPEEILLSCRNRRQLDGIGKGAAAVYGWPDPRGR